jgi:hypothetical protein
MISLVAAAKSANSIVSFVEGGALASAFAGIGIQLAKDALSKASHAKDKRAQVWSAINHLESAESALIAVVSAVDLLLRPSASWVDRLRYGVRCSIVQPPNMMMGQYHCTPL